MSFQRITTIGSIPATNSEAIASRLQAVALVLEPVDLDEERHEVGAARSARSAPATCSPAPTSTSANSDGLLHRRLDAVEPSMSAVCSA